MNVRFFAGTKAQYLSLPTPRNPLGLYFCEDTKELFWADRLLTDGMRVVPTFADLPSRAVDAADGVVYYVTETRNGYTLSPDRSEWLQTIYAPATDAYIVPESEIYNTVTTVGAVRDIEAKIYKTIDERIANIEVGESGNGVKAIYFAGVKLDELDGTFTIDRLCALRALGFSIPEDLGDNEIELVTKEYVDSQIAAITRVDLTQYYTKSEIEALIPDTAGFVKKEELPLVPTKVSELENDAGYLTEHQDLSEYVKKTDLPNVSIFATKTELADAIKSIEHPKVDLTGYATEDYVSTIANTQKYEVLPFEGALISYADTEVRVNTQHVDISTLPPQNAGDGSSDSYYYMTFRAYAPEGATSVIEGQSDKMDAEHSELAVDKYGRQYTTIWAAIAMKSGNTWIKYGDMSNVGERVGKYLGFYYNFHWYAGDKLIGMDKVRVILTNDSCHNDLVPDAVARRIDDKVSAVNTTVNNITKQVQNIEENYVTNQILKDMNYLTVEEATTQLEQIVEEKVQDAVTPNSINYDTF